MTHALEDVIIIGGGPAGSTAAAYLAMDGYRVTVLEKEKFPREHVGESLLPFCYQIFKELGVLEELTRRFARKPGVRFIDSDGSTQTTWCFGHVLKDESYLSFHVRRAEFDQLLLENARQKGATVYEETRVNRVDMNEYVTVEAVGPLGEKQVFRGRFLIDASGRDTFLATRMRTKMPHPELDRAAISTHWVKAKFIEGLQEGLLQIVYLGGEKKGWIWMIPVSYGRISIGVVLNHAAIREKKEQLQKAGVENWQRALYLEEIMSSPFVRDVLEGAEIAQPLAFNGNYSYLVREKFGQNFALIGDASTFIDPILASGVYLSIKSASLVARAIHQKLAGDNGRALTAAYGQIEGAYKLVNKAIHMFYNPVSVNWAQVGSAEGLIHQEHENALAVGHYLLAGDFFERHQEYSDFLDLLQEPSLYQKYKKLVIEREEFQASSCGMSRMEIFHELLDTSSQGMAGA